MLIPADLHEGFIHVLLVLAMYVLLEGVFGFYDVYEFVHVYDDMLRGAPSASRHGAHAAPWL